MDTVLDMLKHSDIPLTIATVFLAWATIHLWTEREKARTRERIVSKLVPWRHTRTVSWDDGKGAHFSEVDSTEIGERDEGGDAPDEPR